MVGAVAGHRKGDESEDYSSKHQSTGTSTAIGRSKEIRSESRVVNETIVNLGKGKQ